MAVVLTLDGQTIKTPNKFNISRYKLSKSERVASGKMTMDIIARKLKFSLKYSVLAGADLKTILDILDTNTAFYAFTYTDDDGAAKSVTVYPGAITQDKFRSTPWYWKDVEFDLIEQ